ncbi:TPA: carbon-nitrogen hydrolase [Candidatus Woesearchaeota archaeon]|nr:carbon-nitrogen hydrolase [Candidatus Woesearchaeota archaeon]
MTPAQTTVKIALLQLAGEETPEANRKKSIAKIREAAKNGAKIICLQELFTTTYFPYTEDHQHFALAESIPGPTTEEMSRLAKELKVVLIAPFFEKRAQGVFHNSAVVIDSDGKLLGTYRKMHIPDDPCFYEKFYFAPGDLGFKSFKTAYGTIGVLICWDQWYPEGARLTALSGAQIIFYPTAIGYFDEDANDVQKELEDAWETIQRSHAIANGVFVASVNRVGKEGKTNFWGRSFVSSPFGKVLVKADDKEKILYAECDLNEIETTRQLWPFFRDRRIDAYQDILLRHKNQ